MPVWVTSFGIRHGFVDPVLDLIPFVAAGDSHVDFIVDKGVLYLEIKISKM